MKLRNKVHIFIHIEKKINKQEKISIQRLLIENKDLRKSFLSDEGSFCGFLIRYGFKKSMVVYKDFNGIYISENIQYQ